VTALYNRLAALPAGLISTGGASNNWAVSGSHSAGGGALMAGDPHLHLTLPAIWFQLTMDSPGFHSSGVSVPGTPIVLIGHNQHISWSLTDAQNQQTFFYLEHQDAAHPGEYLWKGKWTKYKTVDYAIPVLGQAPDHLTVKISVHGPVVTDRGQNVSVWFTGIIPSHDISVLMQINQAANWEDFRNDLSQWHGSAHNFVYADDQGNIGMISAGYYPQVAPGCEPWLPMPGTGEDDVIGTIPYDQIPQVYDPPDGFVFSANERQVTGDYPYYIGTAADFFDPGYRANEIHRFLSDRLAGGQKVTIADMMALQTDTRDFLASEIVPQVLITLKTRTVTGNEKAAMDALSGWDYHMDVGSAAASIWWTFWQAYLAATFDPWWRTHNVKVDMSEVEDVLGQDLEAWTLNDPTNAAFTLVGSAQNAGDVMQAAFHTAVISLTTRLGSDPARWTWGRIHARLIESLALIPGLSYGPLPDRGDGRTPLAAPDFPSSHGPSWRMVVDWGAHTFSGIYPGGQSENPASPWYSNEVTTWWNGKYAPMLDFTQAASSPGAAVWSLQG
jgi:penicillin G amidase